MIRKYPTSVVLGVLTLICCPLHLNSQEITVIAHRGNASEAPENTLPAFRSAEENGAACIECDIHLTKEGVPVIIHDRFLSRTTDIPAPVAIETLTLEQIKALDAGRWFHDQFRGTEVLTLAELLETDLGGMGMMLEIKVDSAPNERLAEAVGEELLRHSAALRDLAVVVGSQSPEIFRLIQKHIPYRPAVAIIGEAAHLSAFPNPDIYAFEKTLISETLIRDAHQKGKTVWVWTVDDPAEMVELINLGVDGIITNTPKILREVLGALHHSSQLFVEHRQ